MSSADKKTADAFAQSWNRIGSVYTREQFLEWFAPLTPEDLRGRSVLELGFGNGSLLVHAAQCAPARLAGVDLGDTLAQTRLNLAELAPNVELHQGDLTSVELGTFDVVYCIGVLHHLDSPGEGFASVLRHTRAGGRFHCWVYAREGNAVIRWLVDPLRRVTSRLPWWFTKYLVATPLVVPYFLYAKTIRALGISRLPLPLLEYTRWIASEPFRFFRHVAFDQLVTPRTRYIDRETVERWLSDSDSSETYVIHRNGNSWKFGGRKRL